MAAILLPTLSSEKENDRILSQILLQFILRAQLTKI